MTADEGRAQFRWVNQQISALVSSVRTNNEVVMERLGRVETQLAAGTHGE
jgi:hypothetical protein